MKRKIYDLLEGASLEEGHCSSTAIAPDAIRLSSAPKGRTARSETKRAAPVPPLPMNVWLWDDEAFGPCPAPIRLDLPSGPDNPWNPREVFD